nr:hypothetical protein [Tanacetum cinerariifolium]
MRTIIKKEVNAQLPQTLPQAISNVATLVIKKNVTESLETAVLTRSSSQPQSLYEVAATLSEFKLTKILIDKIEKNKSLFSLKRSQDDKDKDQDQTKGRKEENQVKMSSHPKIQGVGVASCCRGLKNRGGGGVSVAKIDVIS